MCVCMRVCMRVCISMCMCMCMRMCMQHDNLACLRHRLQLPEEGLREHAIWCLVRPQHLSPALPRLLLLSALELWPASQQLLTYVSHGLLCSDLWLQLPWRSLLKKGGLLRHRMAFLDGSTDCWVALRTQNESRSRSDRDEGLLCHRQRIPKLELSHLQHPGGS